MERPFKQEELRILRKRSSPRQHESNGLAALPGCLLYILVIIAYGLLASSLSRSLSMFWSAVLPVPIIGVTYFLIRLIIRENASPEYGHALIETVTASGIELNQTANGYTIKVMHASGEITWSGKITIIYYSDNQPDKEAGFKRTMQHYGVDTAAVANGYTMPLETLLTMSNDVLWVEFVADHQSSMYNLPNWLLKDYFRTEYNLIRSSKTGELLFVGLVGGAKNYFGNSITFDGSNIRYASYL